MSQSIALAEQKDKLEKQLFHPRTMTLVKESFPGNLDSKKFIRVAQQVIYRNPDLLECDPVSLVIGIVQIAATGLMVDNYHAHLVPFWDKKRGKIATPIIDNKGYIALALATGQIAKIHLDVVHADDEFDYQYGTSPKLDHKPSGSRVFNSIDDIVCSYSIVYYKDRSVDPDFYVCTQDQLKRAMASSQTGRKGFGPWVDSPDEMAKKTAFLRHKKTLYLRFGSTTDTIDANIDRLENHKPEYDLEIESQVTGIEPIAQPEASSEPTKPTPKADILQRKRQASQPKDEKPKQSSLLDDEEEEEEPTTIENQADDDGGLGPTSKESPDVKEELINGIIAKIKEHGLTNKGVVDFCVKKNYIYPSGPKGSFPTLNDVPNGKLQDLLVHFDDLVPNFQ